MGSCAIQRNRCWRIGFDVGAALYGIAAVAEDDAVKNQDKQFIIWNDRSGMLLGVVQGLPDSLRYNCLNKRLDKNTIRSLQDFITRFSNPIKDVDEWSEIGSDARHLAQQLGFRPEDDPWATEEGEEKIRQTLSGIE